MIPLKNSAGEISHEFNYSITDQQSFAELSGDFNPIHLDSIIARRELFGEIVVHGVHLVLQALNLVAEYSMAEDEIILKSVKVKFFNPAFISKLLKLSANLAQNHLKAQIRDEKGLLLTELAIEFSSPEVNLENNFIVPECFDYKPAGITSVDSISSLSGESKLYLDQRACKKLFPFLLTRFTTSQVSELLSLTRIVGMKCPGLQSLFSGIDLKFAPNSTTTMTYKVKSVVEKFSIVNLSVEGPTLYGELLTIFRPQVVRQPSIGNIADEISPSCFRNLRALIIGGSRGIGETTAKMIAAGGGSPIITYHRGKSEADAICKEINEAGFFCQSTQMSIDDIESGDVLDMEDFNTIFYYPSPKILGSNVFDKELFANFCYYYVEQFSALMARIKSKSKNKTIVFFPSTVAIDEKTPGLTEYIMAKGAGEYLSETINKELRNIHIYIKRLPRLQTDQTLNLQNYPAENVNDVMHPILLEITDLIGDPI